MSRSIRKFPIVSDQQHSRGYARKAKRDAARAVRNADDVPSGRAYRKYSCSWNICDYKSYWPEMPEKYRRK